jgi:hypothetical protein
MSDQCFSKFLLRSHSQQILYTLNLQSRFLFRTTGFRSGNLFDIYFFADTVTTFLSP